MSPRPRKRGGPRGKPHGRRRPSGGRRRPSGVEFWGDPEALPPARQDVRITEEPAAIPRSLGPAPLPGHELVAEHYFTAVYERAVMLAGALAAAGELIKPEELVEELGD